MATELIVGLDIDRAERAQEILEACPSCRWFKVGSQLFTRTGPDIVRLVAAAGRRVMLDLKFHDIPNTVHEAVRAAADLGADLVTIHASGGRSMVQAARDAATGTDTRILAVTILTSLSEDALRDEVGMAESPASAVRRLAGLAVASGADGVVCSPREIGVVREAIGADKIIVTPGVRPGWASSDDQRRTMTPCEAARAGADYVVVARPVLQHADPAEAVRMIQEDLAVS